MEQEQLPLEAVIDVYANAFERGEISRATAVRSAAFVVLTVPEKHAYLAARFALADWRVAIRSGGPPPARTNLGLEDGIAPWFPTIDAPPPSAADERGDGVAIGVDAPAVPVGAVAVHGSDATGSDATQQSDVRRSPTVGAPVDWSISARHLGPAPAVVATRDNAFADDANADHRCNAETGALAAPAEPFGTVVSREGLQESAAGPARDVRAGAVPQRADTPDALRPVVPNGDKTSRGDEVNVSGSRTAARIADGEASLEAITGPPTENGRCDDAGPRAEESHGVLPRGAASSRVSQSGMRDEHGATSRPSKDESIDVVSGRYWTIERAAAILDTTPAALRAQLQRRVSKAGLPAGGIELGGGIVARKFGARSWRLWIPHS